MRRRWLSGRAAVLHAVTGVVAPLCLLATWWQVERALSGNVLSYLYALEWPTFAGVAVWAWWHLIHTEVDPALRPGPTPPTWLMWDRGQESPELRAYNQYLLQLHLSGQAQRWRRFRRSQLAGTVARPPALPAGVEGGADGDAPPR